MPSELADVLDTLARVTETCDRTLRREWKKPGEKGMELPGKPYNRMLIRVLEGARGLDSKEFNQVNEVLVRILREDSANAFSPCSARS